MNAMKRIVRTNSLIAARFIFAISFVAVGFVAETIFVHAAPRERTNVVSTIQKHAPGGNVMLAGFGLR
jgi:hypothetical protein